MLQNAVDALHFADLNALGQASWTMTHCLLLEHSPLAEVVCGCCCRAALLDALQKVGMRWRPLRQRYASNILLSTHGRDLTRLKSYVDDGDDYQTLYKMVYNDFQGEAQRSVLQHISTQGQIALQELQTVAPTAPPGVCLKVCYG